MTYIYKGVSKTFLLPKAYLLEGEVYVGAGWYYTDSFGVWGEQSTGVTEEDIECVIPDEFLMEVE